MTRMSKQELSEIISRDKPGYEIVEHESAAAEPDADPAPAAGVTDHVTDLDELRRRYLGDGAAVPATEPASPMADSSDDDDESSDDEDEIVVLNPRDSGADPWAPGPGRKSVIVSGKERRVIAEQG